MGIWISHRIELYTCRFWQRDWKFPKTIQIWEILDLVILTKNSFSPLEWEFYTDYASKHADFGNTIEIVLNLFKFKKFRF